jgi:hypothetical protein
MLPITTQAFLALIFIFLPQPNTRNDIFIHRKSLSPQFFINMVSAFVSVVSFHFLLLTSYVSNPTPGFSLLDTIRLINHIRIPSDIISIRSRYRHEKRLSVPFPYLARNTIVHVSSINRDQFLWPACLGSQQRTTQFADENNIEN